MGFPLAAAITAALLYFAPLYLEGMAENWHLIIFIIGIILVLVEIFAIPGFGVTGVLGIIGIVTGLAFVMIDKIVFRFGPSGDGVREVVAAFAIVAAVSAHFILSFRSGFQGSSFPRTGSSEAWRSRPSVNQV